MKSSDPTFAETHATAAPKHIPTIHKPLNVPLIRPWNIELKPWPFWSQLGDWTAADGQPDENAQNDCGPECVAMALKYLTGIEMPADYIKDVMYGEGYTGYTDVAHLERFFNQLTETRVVIMLAYTQAHLLWLEWTYLKRGWPLIGLFSFSAPGAPDGHFRAVIGQNANQAITADPWTARRRTESHASHWAWSKGLLIGIQRTRRLGDH
jgi:hypothetical protein